MLDLNLQTVKGVIPDHVPLDPRITTLSLEEAQSRVWPDYWVQHNIADNKSWKRLRASYQTFWRSARPWMVIEAPVFRYNQANPMGDDAYWRWSWLSYYFNSGIHYPEDCPPDRWQQIQSEQNIQIQDWHRPGKHILFMMQRPGDSSNKPMADEYGSYEEFVKQSLWSIRSHTRRKILIRLHPLKLDDQLEFIEPLTQSIPGVEISPYSPRHRTNNSHVISSDSLYSDFDQAHTVIGANSNSLVESVCAGIPTVSLSKTAMARPVTMTRFEQIEQPFTKPNRQQWLNNLGYCQWRADEVRRGLAVDNLMQFSDKAMKMMKQQQHFIDHDHYRYSQLWKFHRREQNLLNKANKRRNKQCQQ